MNLGGMGEMGVRGVLIYCADYYCSHSVALSADHREAAIPERDMRFLTSASESVAFVM
jgi:hypothetical protein